MLPACRQIQSQSHNGLVEERDANFNCMGHADAVNPLKLSTVQIVEQPQCQYLRLWGRRKVGVSPEQLVSSLTTKCNAKAVTSDFSHNVILNCGIPDDIGFECLDVINHVSQYIKKVVVCDFDFATGNL
jgi:hypothetical protein